MTSDSEITALILSGGMGTRMGGVDKGLVPYLGKPLIGHMIDRVRPQVKDLLISCNPSNKQNYDLYSTYGYPLVEDQPLSKQPEPTEKSPGPLAGILSANHRIISPLCFICPCDMPLIPQDLVQQLSDALGEHEVAIGRFDNRLQPLLFLIRSEKIQTITQRISLNDLSVKGWLGTLNAVEVDIRGSSNQLKNFNYAKDLLE